MAVTTCATEANTHKAQFSAATLHMHTPTHFENQGRVTSTYTCFPLDWKQLGFEAFRKVIKHIEMQK